MSIAFLCSSGPLTDAVGHQATISTSILLFINLKFISNWQKYFNLNPAVRLVANYDRVAAVHWQGKIIWFIRFIIEELVTCLNVNSFISPRHPVTRRPAAQVTETVCNIFLKISSFIHLFWSTFKSWLVVHGASGGFIWMWCYSLKKWIFDWI